MTITTPTDMRKNIIILIAIFLATHPYAQDPYTDYIGAGHAEGIIVTTSSNYLDATGIKTLDGSGMDVPKFKASRFLAHSTLGADIELIDRVTNIGEEAWLEEQFAIPPSYLTPVMESIWQERLNDIVTYTETKPEDVFGPWAVDFNYAWWQVNMTNEDLLRHRVALALSEILVVSINSDLRDRANALTSYYDVLLTHAFGNYQDLLMEVTTHLSMGFYLSHLNNPRSIPELNQRPDENYAREIMQLFTIGLYELNMDGSRKMDGGKPIPTYDNDDIKEFAKVFTGLGPGDINMYVDWTDQPYFGLGFWGSDATVPMKMYEEFHEPGPKYLLNGYVIPEGQSGMQDIEDAVTHLFNHPNVGPFIARRLIQRLVKSNPSPAYIQRVAEAFNEQNGAPRGDMKNVIRAILLDPEARDSEYVSNKAASRLREPLVRYTHLARSMPKDAPLGRYWNNGYNSVENLKQHVLASPTVFNFFTPDYEPVGDISDAGLVAPEFKIHNTSTAINYINMVNEWVVWWALMYSWEMDWGDLPVLLDLSHLEPLAENPDVLINELDIIFTHGQLTDETRAIIRNAVENMTWNNEAKVKMALYLLMISPDYTVMK